jgi:hypothetical protein
MKTEFVPDNVNEKDLKDEVLRRNAKVGYTTSLGEPPYKTKIMSMPPSKKYQENYRLAFGHD